YVFDPPPPGRGDHRVSTLPIDSTYVIDSAPAERTGRTPRSSRSPREDHPRPTPHTSSTPPPPPGRDHHGRRADHRARTLPDRLTSVFGRTPTGRRSRSPPFRDLQSCARAYFGAC